MSRIGGRRATNLSLNEVLMDEARGLNINISRAAEQGIAEAVKTERERRWRAENADAISEMNNFVDSKGLPLGKLRMF